MSIGTFRPNFFHRLGDAWSAIKGVPNPGLFYPPQQRSSGIGPINWPGWIEWERENQEEGRKDLQRAKLAVTSPWVYADVQAIANEFSTSELIIKERRGTKLEDVDNHPLELVWESPNEHMGRSFLTSFWAWSYVLAGKAYIYWVPDTSGTELMEAWPVPPWMIRPIPDKENFISGYAFKSSQYSDIITIPPELITFSHSVNLFDVRDGLSFLAAAYQEIQSDLAASAWNLNFFDENNGVPDGMIGLSPDALDQDVERVRWELRDFFGGTKRGIAVARTGDMKWQEFGRSQKDMEFGAGREFASKVIGRTLGFPDGYWSDLANRANAEQARRTMISGAVWPLLVRLSEDMNAQRRGVVQRWYGDSFRVEFKDIRPEDKEGKRAELTAYQPFYTLNELRELTGQEAFDKADPRGLMLVAEIAKGAPLPGTPAALLLEDLQAEKDEAAAQEAAAKVESGEIPDPSLEEAPIDGEPLPDDIAPEEAPIEGAIKAQSDEERAMFAKMGGGKGPGKGYDKSKSTLTTGKEKGGGGSGSANLSHHSDSEISNMREKAQADINENAKQRKAIAAEHSDLVKRANASTDEAEQSRLFAKQEVTSAKLKKLDAERERLNKHFDAVHDEGVNRARAKTDAMTGKAVGDLALWETKALHDFKRRGRVYRAFVSDTIDADEHGRISAALKAAESVLEIKAAFKRDAVDKLLESVDKDARAWAEEATSDGT